jgi:hypothetical protein
MSLAVAIALAVMQDLPNREQAQHWANIAVRVGATPAELADAWAAWETAHEPLTVAAQ